ncbi:glycosyltransferase [Stenotrophomonas sp. TWI602]|uniref:glycosyltransferase n=1 Tax=Stenotrophomonas sp. TWI602 TaxID=3136786 RepID=UPI003208F40C
MNSVVHVVEATATGTLSMVCTAANLMADKGWQVHVIYSLRPETPEDLSSMFHEAVKLQRIDMSAGAALSGGANLRRALIAIDPDVIHLHSSFAGFIGRLATVGAVRRARIFYSPHCISMMRKDAGKKVYVYALLERIAAIKPATYLACSESERDSIRRWLGVDAKLLENAVEVQNTSSPHALQSSPRKPGARTITTIGGIRTQKNPALFAEIATHCKARGLNVNFVWIGDGEPELVKVLHDAGVDVTGWMHKTNVYGILASSDIYLSTASWEGLPVSIIEAMACGLLTLATTCEGNRDVVVHGITGLLFNNGLQGADLIEDIITRRLDPSEMIKNAKDETKARFSIQRFSEELLLAYCPTLTNSVTSDGN